MPGDVFCIARTKKNLASDAYLRLEQSMNFPTEPFGLPDTAPELARRFAWIMAGLGALIARRFLKMPHLSQFTVQLWNYLNRATRRFYQALTGKPTKARAKRARGDRTETGQVRPIALPSGRGWIVRELGWEAAAYLGAMEVLLAEVATRTALAEQPRAGRILRPICRMLGVSAEATPKIVVAQQEPVVVEQRLEPGGLPGVVGDCEVLATSG